MFDKSYKMANVISTTFFTRRILFLSFCAFIGFSLVTTCEAQSIVGKWKGVSVKNYYSADYARQTGKSMEEKFAKDAGNSEISYNADHTFVMNMSSPNSPDIMTMKGIWAATQDQLSMTLEAKYSPRKMTTTATFIIHGNTMETTAIIPPPSRIIKTISVATRI
jgi:Domain of unknown function (DUF5004)